MSSVGGAEGLGLTHVSDKRLWVGSFPHDQESAQSLFLWLENRFPRSYKIVSCLSEPEQIELQSDELLLPLAHELGYSLAECVENFPMAPNTPGALKQLLRFCITHDTYLAKQESNVLVVLCKTGRGRSLMLAACLLLHLSKVGHAMTAEEAISMACESRGGGGNLLYPSQVRYVHYYERLLRSQRGEYTQTLRLNAVRIAPVPSFDPSIINQGCTPFAVVSVLAQIAEPAALESHMPFRCHVVYHQQEKLAREKKAPSFYSKTQGEKEVELDFQETNGVYVRGDTIVSLFSQEHKMLQLCFHTAFVEENYLCFDKDTLDLAHMDVKHRRFDADMRVELFFSKVGDTPELNIGDLVTSADHDQLGKEMIIMCPEKEEN